jgi:hypothetical protein
MLHSGTISAREIQNAARTAGISPKTLRRTRERLGVTVTKSSFGGGWEWRLDLEDAPKMPEDAQETHSQGAGNLGTFGAPSQDAKEAA